MKYSRHKILSQEPKQTYEGSFVYIITGGIKRQRYFKMHCLHIWLRMDADTLSIGNTGGLMFGRTYRKDDMRYNLHGRRKFKKDVNKFTHTIYEIDELTYFKEVI